LPCSRCLLTECLESELEETKGRLRAAMNQATRFVLGKGATIPIDMKIYRDRFEDEDGLQRFERVMRQLERVESVTKDAA
jgi:hypothetical protein